MEARFRTKVDLSGEATIPWKTIFTPIKDRIKILRRNELIPHMKKSTFPCEPFFILRQRQRFRGCHGNLEVDLLCGKK